MFAKRRTTPHVYNEIEKGLIDYNKSEYYHPSNVDDFMFQESKPPHSDCECVTLTSDITMLFNQERLDRMSRESLLKHFDSMSVQSSKFSDIRSKLNDDQLISIVKSRYIQSPSELMAYSNYLVNSYGAEMAAVVVSHGNSAPDTEPSSAPAD